LAHDTGCAAEERGSGPVDADLGDQLLSGGDPNPGDLIQLGHLRRERDDRSSMVVSAR
jgi:hypothetical protein